MRILPPLSLATFLLVMIPAAAACQADPSEVLKFEIGAGSHAASGWGGGPPATLSIDSATVHGGRFAGRIVRDSASPADFSTFTLHLARTFAGDSLVLRGWLRTLDVEGSVAIWMREDGSSGPLQFATTQQLGISGTTGWTEYRIALPIDRRARSLTLGALLAGRGTMWVDDLELTVDGRPAAESDPAEITVTAVELDREFDSGSGIEPAALSPIQARNLAMLGRIWGFAKYHHPRVAAGELNWDYELFRVMPAVLAATTRPEAAQAISRWLTELGELEPCGPCAQPPGEVHLAAPIDWIGDESLLGEELSAVLRGIHQRRPPDGAQYFVDQVQGVGNPDFSAEKALPAALVSDAGYRLLALFRLWNVIEYWFPYRDLVEGDWDATLVEFVPQIMAATDPLEFRLDMLRLIARVSDTHANLWSVLAARPPRGNAQVPVTIRFIDGRPVVAGYSHPELGPATGLLPGDEIQALDGTPIDSLVRVWAPYYAASNEPTRLRDMARTLTLGEPGSVRLSVLRNGAPLQVTARRAPLAQLDRAGDVRHDLPGEPFQMLSDEVAYLKLSSVRAADASAYVERARGAAVLVIDIRNYPSEFVVFALGSHLVAEPTPFAMFTAADPANPGAFRFTSPVVLQPRSPRFEGRVVILVDEVSQSQAEYTAMAFRAAPGAIVVGSTTAGADGNVSQIPLFADMPGLISGIGVFYPDRRPTQRVGIVPDVEVRPTVAGLRDGRDEVLEAAVSHALGREWRLPR